LIEAEAALEAALKQAQSYNSDDRRLAAAFNALGDLKMIQGDTGKAEILFRRGIVILEKSVDSSSPELTVALAYLAEACATNGKTDEALRLYRRALSLTNTDPYRYSESAARLADIASLEKALGHEQQAEASYRRALTITENALGPEHRLVAERLNDLALFHHTLGQFAKAEPLYTRALSIKEKILGPGHPEVIAALNDLALFDEAQGNDIAAESRYQQALERIERTHGRDSPKLISTLEHYSHLLRRTKRNTQADGLDARSSSLTRRNRTQAKP
jgi:tetratricopeptide (TPR) repeat protein